MNAKFIAAAALAVVGFLPMFADRPPLISEKRVATLEARVSALETQVAEPPAPGAANAPDGVPIENVIKLGLVDCKPIEENTLYISFSCKAEITNMSNTPRELSVNFIAYDKAKFEIYRSFDNIVIKANATVTHTQQVFVNLPQAKDVVQFGVEVMGF